MGRRQFSREFKLETIQLVKERGVSVAQASRDLDIVRMCCGVGSRRPVPIPRRRSPVRGSSSQSRWRSRDLAGAVALRGSRCLA